MFGGPDSSGLQVLKWWRYQRQEKVSIERNSTWFGGKKSWEKQYCIYFTRRSLIYEIMKSK
jgi:hypothetical protein